MMTSESQVREIERFLPNAARVKFNFEIRMALYFDSGWNQEFELGGPWLQMRGDGRTQ